MIRDRAIIVAPNWLGDFIMALPSMDALCRSQGVESVVVVRPSLAEVGPLLPSARILKLEKSTPNLLSAIRRIRRLNPEIALVYPTSFRAALVAYGSGAPIRIGISHPESAWAMTIRISPPGRTVHMVETFSELVRAGGIEVTEELPHIELERFPVSESPIAIEGDFMVVAPGATFGPAKRWEADRFAKLCGLLSEAYSCRIFLVGTEQERSYLEGIRLMYPKRIVNLAGMTTIPELIGILGRARLFVGNDSGVAHAAALSRTRGVVIFGSSSPIWTRPLWHGVTVIYTELPCSPCYRRECPLGHTNCLKQISIDDVFQQCQKVLDTE